MPSSEFGVPLIWPKGTYKSTHVKRMKRRNLVKIPEKMVHASNWRTRYKTITINVPKKPAGADTFMPAPASLKVQDPGPESQSPKSQSSEPRAQTIAPKVQSPEIKVANIKFGKKQHPSHTKEIDSSSMVQKNTVFNTVPEQESFTFIGPAQAVDPIQDVGPAQAVGPAQDVDPIQDVGPAQDVDPIQDVGPAQAVSPAQDVGPAQDVDPIQDVGPTQDELRTCKYCNHCNAIVEENILRQILLCLLGVVIYIELYAQV